MQVGEQSGMEVAIVRAPLMYGPGVKANFVRLMRWVDQERCCRSAPSPTAEPSELLESVRSARACC